MNNEDMMKLASTIGLCPHAFYLAESTDGDKFLMSDFMMSRQLPEDFRDDEYTLLCELEEMFDNGIEVLEQELEMIQNFKGWYENNE